MEICFKIWLLTKYIICFRIHNNNISLKLITAVHFKTKCLKLKVCTYSLKLSKCIHFVQPYFKISYEPMLETIENFCTVDVFVRIIKKNKVLLYSNVCKRFWFLILQISKFITYCLPFFTFTYIIDTNLDCICLFDIYEYVCIGDVFVSTIKT